jgi:aminopeptidase N
MSSELALNGDGIVLVSLKLNGHTLDAANYTASPDQLLLRNLPLGPLRLNIETLVNPSANSQLSGLYRSSGTYCTQCEAEGFRRITYFLDRPDVMAVYTARVEADKIEAPVLLANGNLSVAGDLPDGRHFAVWHDPFPKPSYLFALVGGKFGKVEDHFRTMSGRDVTLRMYVEPGKENLCDYAMASLGRAMRWDEEAFGREYDLDIFMIVAVSDFNMGAMENKGLNIFNDKYVLASAASATDTDFALIEAVIAHEYFHNWTGNRITCRDWFQLCLKEGLTVFRDQEFTSDQRSRVVKRIADVRGLLAHQFIEDAGPLAHPVRPETYREINNLYTGTVYAKGAEVVRMVKLLVGADMFRKGMDLYFERHDGEAATVEQFLQCFADLSHRDMTQFMRWYSQAGTPEVTVAEDYDADRMTYRLQLRQGIPSTRTAKEPMVIPLAVGLLDPDGHDIPLDMASRGVIDAGLLVLTKAEEVFEFGGIASRPILSLNRGFSAPVKLRENRPNRELCFLALHDSDRFNRWQAAQALATQILVGNADMLRRGGGDRTDDPGLLAVLESILVDRSLEAAFIAQNLMLPSEAHIAQVIGADLDPDAIFQARQTLRASVGRSLGAKLASVYDAMTSGARYSPDAASSGRRALRNGCLDLLAATGAADAIARAKRQYDYADNMTDRVAALSALSQHDVPEYPAALDDFYDRFSQQPLIIDKWFALQAVVPDAFTLNRVRELMRHPAFSLSNPNRVRALIGTFAHANAVQFNRVDGAGYDLVVSALLEVDARNPQLAASLMTAFGGWRMLEPRRRDKAETALLRVASAPSLSRNVSDVVHRSLAPA